MDTRVASAIARRIAELEAMSDEDLVTQWTDVGRRLATDDADEFRTVYKATAAKFPDAGDAEPSIEQWTKLGERLVHQGPQVRGVVVRVTALNNVRFAELKG